MNRLFTSLIPIFVILALILAGAACTKTESEDSSGGSSGGSSSAPTKFSVDSPPAQLVAAEYKEEQAPETYRAKFSVKDKGDFVIEVTRSWSPRGADRFYNLVKSGFFDHAPFFRVVDGFMVQFGISAYPEVTQVWKDRNILDDHEVTSAKKSKSNKRGTISFACAGADTRSTQVFINFANNRNLDPPLQGGVFTPFGKVVTGMDIVDGLYKGYGDMQEQRNPKGVSANILQMKGLPYIQSDYPLCDVIEQAVIE